MNYRYKPEITYTDEELFKILEQMTDMGGSFVQVLAQLTRLADPINKQKLLRTFKGYYSKYHVFAKRVVDNNKNMVQ